MMYHPNRRIEFLAAISTLWLVSTPALAGPVIINGGFEAVQIGTPFYSSNPSNIPGWTHTGSPGDALLWAVGYTDGGGNVTTAGAGTQFVTLGGGFDGTGSAAWSTTITGLTAGDEYALNFMTATESGYAGGAEPGGPQTMTVGFLSGSSTPSQSFTSTDSTANYWRVWVTQDYTFLATASSAVVEFSVTNQQYDMGLDSVSVDPFTSTVPEPSGLVLFGFGLIAVAVIHRRLIAAPVFTPFQRASSSR